MDNIKEPIPVMDKVLILITKTIKEQGHKNAQLEEVIAQLKGIDRIKS